MDAILSRRSIRLFDPDPVPADVVERLLDALFYAPSAADARPWQFVVIDRKDLLVAMADRMPKCDMLRSAPLAILVCAEPAREKIPGFWPQDCSAATENLLIAACSQGLGGVWIGLHPVEDRVKAVRDILGIPDGLIPFSLTAIGAPAETPDPMERRDPSRVHRNGW